MRVLLVVDSFDREFLAMRLTAAELQKLGAEVRICSRPILNMAYNRFRPQVVLLPKTHKIPNISDLHKNSVVVLAQAESFVGSEDSFKYLSKNLRKEDVDIVCCWGAFDRNFYVENGIFDIENVHVTGHPIVDTWHLPLASSEKDRRGPVVGITSSLRAFTHKALGKNIHPFKSIIGIEEVGESGYFIPPFHAEDWVAFEASWVRNIYQLVKNNPQMQFSLRPHPLENGRHYDVFGQLPNVEVDGKGHIAEWLGSIDTLCSSFSGSMLDAYFCKKTVVSIRNLIPKHILAGIHPSIPGIPHEKFFPAPKTLSSVAAELSKPWHPIPDIDNLGQQVFNFPGEGRPSRRVANIICKFAPDLYKSKKPFSPLPERKIERICGPFSWSPDLRMLMLDFRDFISGTNIATSSYKKHNFRKNSVYLRVAEKIESVL
jgi:surface carbohydrate biosynthesis protein